MFMHVMVNARYDNGRYSHDFRNSMLRDIRLCMIKHMNIIQIKSLFPLNSAK